MAQSKQYTAERYFKQAHRNMFYDVNDAVYVERFELMAASQEQVVSTFFDLLAPTFMKSAIPTEPPAGTYSTGAGTYTALTRTLAITSARNYAATDIGYMVVFHDGANQYIAEVESAPTGITLVLKEGLGLPTGDLPNVVYAIITKAAPVGEAIDFSSLSIMRAGGELKMRLSSTATFKVFYLPNEEFNAWDGTVVGERHKIVWTVLGTDILLKRGSELASYGTLVLNYPAVPERPTANATYMDLPDGPAIQIGIILLERLIAKRKGISLPDRKDELRMLIDGLYRQFKGVVDIEQASQQLKAVA